mmetsp:Transcript_126983/g.355640  ORF Transcript_126983/g.355640 Transcript_126983/m.355640 type:complete len:296 (+) Transcript_126983:135-1022(+)
MEHPHDAQASVQANEVGERQRPHGHVRPQLHRLVDVLRRGDALLQHEHGLVDVGHQDAVRDEARSVLARGVLLAHRRAQGERPAEGRVVRQQAPDDLHERHHGHGVHEVHADEPLRPRQAGAQLRDGDGARVRGEDAGLRQPGRHQRLEDGALRPQVLADGLDDEVEAAGLLHGCAVQAAVAYPLHKGGALGVGHASLLHLLGRPTLDEARAALEACVELVQRKDVHLRMPRGDDGDAGAHLPATHDSEALRHRGGEAAASPADRRRHRGGERHGPRSDHGAGLTPRDKRSSFAA